MTYICIVTHYLALRGGEYAKLLSFLQFAESHGWSCDIYYPLEGPRPRKLEEELQASSSVVDVHPVRLQHRAPHFWRAHQFARRCEFKRDYAIHVLIATPLLLGMAFVRQERDFIAWVSCTYGGEVRHIPRTRFRHYLLYNPLTRRVAARQERACVRDAKLLLGISRYATSQLRRELGAPSEKLRVVPVPVDTDYFTPGEPRCRPRPYVLSVARLDRRKDFPTLLRAFETVRQQADLELRIVGGGPERSRLERLAASLGLEDDLRFLGEVGSSELREQYRGATLFALSSRQEGLGIVLLEAMATALPVVATDSGGSADPVVSGETGFLVDVGDSRALAEAMLQVLGDPEMASRMGCAGRERAVRAFSVSVVHGLLESALAEAMGPAAAPKA